MNSYKFRLEKIVSPLMEDSYYEVLSKPNNINELNVSIDDYFLSLSDCECLHLVRDTFVFLKDYSNIKISVNVNHLMLNNSIIVDYIYKEALDLRIRNVILSLEINECCLSFVNCDDLKKLSGRFSDIDVAFWLDDFGCGSANLSSVITSDFKVIKIDKVIFWNFYLKYNSLLIELIDFIKSYECMVIIEGVESKGHLDFALENNCYSQGYIFNNLTS